jgi:hypothetical protein
MSFTYHGATGLIPLAGETQRIIDGQVIVIEKDFAVRKDRLPNALQSLAPGRPIPGTRYIIDTQPQIEFQQNGFARIRLSALDIDFSADQANVTQGTVGWSQQLASNTIAMSASFTFATGTFRYRRSIFSENQNPNFPDVVEPVLIGSNLQAIGSGGQAIFNFQTTFGESRWIGLQVDRENLYENRAFEYTVQAVCAPSFIRLSSGEATVEYRLGFGFDESIIATIATAGRNRAYYFGPTVLVGARVAQAQRIERLESDLREAEAAFDSAWRGASGVVAAQDPSLIAFFQRRVEFIRDELRRAQQP